MSYFTTFQVLKGGIESGFNHVKPEEYEDRLLQLKGKNVVHVKEVSLDSDSLNSGDVFILDAGMKIFQWNGKQASVKEKNKAGEISRAIREERKGQPVVVTIEEGQEDGDFWEHIGGKGAVSSAEEGGDDIEAERHNKGSKALYQLSDASGTLKFTEKSKGKVLRSHFESQDVFIFDTGFEVMAWIGRGASITEKRNALPKAQEYLSKFNRPAYLPISRINEGAETESFVAALDQ